jgi:fatty-acyl-CoA synthase
MTETSLCHTVTTFQDEKKSFSYAFESVGRTLPFCESKIIDPKSGRMVPLNTDGELCVRGPHIIRGYWDEPEKSKETIDSNGWLKTGDIFSMDSNGYLFFKSRSKDVIIRGGANLYPAEIEAFLRTHSNIDDVQVFGVHKTLIKSHQT